MFFYHPPWRQGKGEAPPRQLGLSLVKLATGRLFDASTKWRSAAARKGGKSPLAAPPPLMAHHRIAQCYVRQRKIHPRLLHQPHFIPSLIPWAD